MSHVHLSEGGFQLVYPLGLWSRFSGVVRFGAWLVNYLHLHLHLHLRLPGAVSIAAGTLVVAHHTAPSCCPRTLAYVHAYYAAFKHV